MALKIQPLDAEHLDAFARFTRDTWPDRPTSGPAWTWRTTDPRGRLRTLVAVRDGDVVASLTVAERTWWTGSGEATVAETFDWFCRPDLRGSGLGIRLLRQVMAASPVVAVGGSPDTLALLPRLGFRVAGESVQLAVPLSSRALPGRAGRTGPLGTAAARARAAWFRGWRDGQVVRVGAPGEAVSRLIRSSPAAAQLPDPGVVAWLRDHGVYEVLEVHAAGECVAWALLRVYDRDGRRDAAAVDLGAADEAAARQLGAVLVDEAVRHGADALLVGASDPTVVSGMRAAGLVERARFPVWAHRLDGPVRVARNIGDGPWLGGTPFERRVPRWRALHDRAVVVDDWTIGIVDRPVTDLLHGAVGPVRWLPPQGDRYYHADPCAVRDGDRLVILCERYDRRSATGSLAVVEHDGSAFSEVRPVEGGPAVHASYPLIVEQGGERFVIPESAAAGELVAYRFARFPDRLERAFTVLAAPVVDGTVFRHEGRWWLLGGLDRYNAELHAWSADRLEGPWTPHPGNPVVCAPGRARMAGRPFVVDGHLVRPGQDGTRTYGGATVLSTVTLSADAYDERPIARLEPVDPWPDGLHTVCGVGDVTVIDGKRRIWGPAHPKLLGLSLGGRVVGRFG